MAESSGAGVVLSIEGPVARIVLDRPHRLNALDRPTMIALADIVDAVAANTAVRAVLLTGSGRGFCSGGDTKAMVSGAMSQGGETPVQTALGGAADLHRTILALATMPKVVVAAVNGPAAGAGVGLAMAADLVLAARSATFSLAYTAIGLSPDGGTTWALTRLVGARRALELFLTNRTFDADEAVAMGLVNRAVADDLLMPEAEALISTLSRGPTRAFAETRALVREALHRDLASQLDAERDAIGRSVQTADLFEGLMASFQKRPPAFTGA